MPFASRFSSATLEAWMVVRLLVIMHISCTMVLMGLTMLCRKRLISSATSTRHPAIQTHMNTLRLLISRIITETGAMQPRVRPLPLESVSMPIR